MVEHLPQAQHSTARSTLHKTAKRVRTYRSERDNARRQTEWTRASISSRIYSSLFPEFHLVGYFFCAHEANSYTFIFGPASAQITIKAHPSPTCVDLACCRQASTASTALRNQSCAKEQNADVRIISADRSATTQAGKTELARAASCRRSSMNISRCVLKTNEEIEICQAPNKCPSTCKQQHLQ